MTQMEWVSVFLFVVFSYIVLTGVVNFIRHYLKIDRTEREQILQAQIDDLTDKVEESEKEIQDLRRQVRLMVKQYEEAIGRLAELQKQHVVATEENRELKEQIKGLKAGFSEIDNRQDRVLFALIGSDDKGLGLDLASIRAVNTETGLEVKVIQDPSPEGLKTALDRARMQRSHIYLHMAINAGKEGYKLDDELVDASWLSSILNGVIVLVVAGTDSDYVGDFLGVVPYVVSMSGGVNHREAAIFSRLFWTEIGKGIGPTRAIKRALERSPTAIRESITTHWET
jgi:cell division protein FtsB